MSLSTLMLFLIATSVASTEPISHQQAQRQQQDRVIVGYLPSYRLDQVDIEQMKGVTDLVYFGLTPTKDGHLPEAAIDDATIAKLQSIKSKLECRLLICIGGWNRSAGFPTLAKEESSRATFVSEVLAFCRQHKFDGVDYDWEHPKDQEELTAYSQLISETAAAFADDKMIVTVAQAGWQDIDKEAYSSLDRVHLMAYDHGFPHATVAKAKADVERLIDWGCPANKIALGVPFYGRNREGDAKAYRRLIELESFDPESDELDGYAFNGPRTIEQKLEFIEKTGLAGIMIWELGHDAAGEKESLLAKIRKHVLQSQSSDE